MIYIANNQYTYIKWGIGYITEDAVVISATGISMRSIKHIKPGEVLRYNKFVMSHYFNGYKDYTFTKR